MNHQRLLVAFLAFSLIVVRLNVFAQEQSPSKMPKRSADMPAWAELLYDNPPNLFKLDSAYNAYYAVHPFVKDNYTRYYRRLHMLYGAFILPDGTIDQNGYEKLKAQTAVQNVHPGNRMISWSALGPYDSWVGTSRVSQTTNTYSIDVCESNTNIAYAASEIGAVFKTTDKGLTWSCVSNPEPIVVADAIAVNPLNPDVVYTAGWKYIFKTSNSGSTWSQVFFAEGSFPNDIQIHPADTALVFVSTELGLYKSTDGGATWDTVPGMTKRAYDIEINPVNKNEIYVLGKTDTLLEFWKSTNKGVSFTKRTWSTPGVSHWEGRMSVTAADSNRVYAILLASDNYPRIMRSNDKGETWSLVATGGTPTCQLNNGQGYYDLSIVADAMNADNLIAGTQSYQKSVDGGSTWNWFPSGTHIHVDLQDGKSIGTDTWLATDGGISISTDFHTTAPNFSFRQKGIDGYNMWGFGQGWDEDIMAMSAYHNGACILSEDFYGDGKARMVHGGEPATGYVLHGKSRVVAYSQGSTVFLAPETITGDVSLLPSLTKFPNEYGYGWDASELLIHPQCYNIYYVGSDQSLWKSVDGGLNWTELYNFSKRMCMIEQSRSNPNIFYVATDAKLYKSVNEGATWNEITLPAGCSIWRLMLALSFTNPDELWITSQGNGNGYKVFKTNDGGASWINLTTPTLDNIESSEVVTQAGTDGGVYFIGIIGGKVFYRNNTLSDWQDYSPGRPVNYYMLRNHPFYRDGKLRTGGSRGVWEAPFYENSLPVAKASVDKWTGICSEDTFYFYDYSASNYATDTRQWSFPGASYISSATAVKPKVLYPGAGTYEAYLSISQGGYTSYDTIKNIMVLDADYCYPDSVPGKALSLNGTSSYASISAMNLNSNTVTMMAWIKPMGPQNDWAGILQCRGGNTVAGMNILANNELRYNWDDVNWWWSPGLIIPDSQWSHVAMAVSPTSVKLYLNGVEATLSVAHSPTEFNHRLLIGYDELDANRKFKGLIDEVCIYNRSLSADEIRMRMNLVKTDADTGLINYYQFNEPDGMAQDRIGKLDATLISAERAKSTVPVGPGVFAKQNIVAGGLYDFAPTGIKLAFPSAGNKPNGLVYATRIHISPDTIPDFLPNNSIYYVIRNYGTNSAFAKLDSIVIDNAGDISVTEQVNPSQISLFKRAANADGPLWAVADTADALIAGTSGSAKFSSETNQTSFGQFVLSRTDNVPEVNIYGAVVVQSGIYAVPDVDLTISSTEETTINLGSGAVYALKVKTNKNYTVTPSKNNDSIPSQGVSTIDLALMQRHVLSIDTLDSPYKIIPADVNGTSSVTTIDIGLARSLILGNSSTFPGDRLWAFISTSYPIPDVLHPFPYENFRTFNNVTEEQIAQSFIGMKLGDVNQSWNPSALKTSSYGEVQFLMDEYSVLPDDEIIVPVKAKDFTEIAGYQFTLSWNPGVLSFLEVNNVAIPGYYGIQRTSDGWLTTSWNDATGGSVSLSDDEIVFELKFKVIGENGSYSEIKIGSEITASESFNDRFELLDIVPTNGMVSVNTVGVSNPSSEFYSLSVQPNPFTKTTVIIFTIPEDETVSIIIYDLLGKKIKQHHANYKAGEHAIEWAGDDDAGRTLSKGLYHLRMLAGEHSSGVKAVLLR